MCYETKAYAASGSPFGLAGLFLFVFIVLRQSLARYHMLSFSHLGSFEDP